MSDAQSGGAASESDGRTIWPLVAAAAVIGVVLLGIVVSNLLAPVDDDQADAERIAAAVQGFAAAWSDQENRRPAMVCPGFDAARSPLPADPGEVTVTRVDKVAVAGDQATAEVTADIGAETRTSVWNFTRAGEVWRVCHRPE